MSKTAIILFTGDRVDWIDFTIDSCFNFFEKGNISTTSDIYLVTWLENVESKYDIKILNYKKPALEDINSFQKTKQQLTYSPDIQNRIGFGHYILFGCVPQIIENNKHIFQKYDYILKCRSDLVFDTPKFNFDLNFIYTFECFWGGCRYVKNYSNDHFVFGISNQVLKCISYNLEDCKIGNHWNPESYMTELYNNSDLDKIELTTDKYYLLSKDRESRKFIGYPMQTVNQIDLEYFDKIGLDWKKIKFTNKYDF